MTNKLYGKQVLTDSFFNFITVLIGRVGGLIFTVILARLLAPELFGLYNLTLSIALIALTLANFGIDEAMVRYVSANYGKNKAKAKSYFFYLFKMKLAILVSASLLLVILAKPLAWFYENPTLFFPLVVSAAYVILMSLSQFISALFYVFQDVKKYAIKEIVFQIARLGFLPLVFALLANYLVAGIFIVLSISSFIALLVSTFLLFRKEKFLIQKQKKTSFDKKELFNYLKFLTAGSITGIVFLYVDVIILGKFVSLENIGFYRAASTVIMSVASILVLTPVIYPIFSQNSGKRLSDIFNKIFYYSSILTIPVSVGVIFIAKPLIRALYGYEYLPAAIPLYFLALLVFSFGTGDLYLSLINSQGKSKHTARTAIISTIMNVILNIVLIVWLIDYGEIYAVAGAAISTVISRYYSFFSLAFYSKKIGVHTKMSSLIKPIIASLFMAAYLFAFNNMVYSKLTLILGAFEIISAAMVYFAALYIIRGISINEIIYIKNLVLQTLKKKRVN